MSRNVHNQSKFTRLETEYEIQTGEEIEKYTWAWVDMEFLFEWKGGISVWKLEEKFYFYKQPCFFYMFYKHNSLYWQ